MSYLNFPRLAFLGTFKASPSTVNNATVNFYAYVQPENFYTPGGNPPNNLDAYSDPASFPPEIGPIPNAIQGVSWNPNGLALFSFQGKIESATFDAANPQTSGDPLIGAVITTAIPNQRHPAKLVDLDPDQQGVTGFYGMGISVTLADGSGFIARISDAAMQAGKVPTLNDLWFQRVPSGGGDSAASSNIQWVYDDIQIVGKSTALLEKFLAACPDGISIQITVDDFHDAQSLQPSQGFFGRIVGALGPARSDEPYSFVAGRRLGAVATATPQYFPAAAQICGNVLSIDLANSVPLDSTTNLQPVDEPSPMAIGYVANGTFVPLTHGHKVNYSKSYYEKFAGVNDIALTDDEVAKLKHHPLAAQVGNKMVLAEDDQGRFAMPERWSIRLSPGESAAVRFWTLQFGKPVQLPFTLAIPATPLLPSDGSLDSLNVPADGLTWKFEEAKLPGVTRIVFTAGASLPRAFLPPVRQWVGSALYLVSSGTGDNWQQWGQVLSVAGGISLIVWCDGPPPATAQNPTFADIKNIMQGYAALYPGMTAKVDIGDPAVLNDPSSAGRILHVMSLPLIDPGHMPVTRDLSPANRDMILNYLRKVTASAAPTA